VPDDTEARLRWRCRRGMKELDLLLARWLEQRWAGADDARRRDFEWLIEQPDPDLADWLLGGARPAGASRAALIDDIVRRQA
jgi:antitoxin CptB